jgi:hypothetical protein
VSGRGKPWPEAFFQRKSASTTDSAGDDPIDEGETPDEV